jgi:ribulose-5-phosphate 4-epimerase/fuculose-1-phosphate aldolase
MGFQKNCRLLKRNGMTPRNGGNIIVLENHGCVAVTEDLNAAVNLVRATHLKIKEKGLNAVSRIRILSHY